MADERPAQELPKLSGQVYFQVARDDPKDPEWLKVRNTLTLALRLNENRIVGTIQGQRRLTIKVGPRHVGIRDTATFRGRLRGGPYPPRGVALDLQILQPGRGWRVFAATRTHRKGRFTVRYRFNSAVGGRFRFRVRMRTSDAYPYARTASRSVSVSVS